MTKQLIIICALVLMVLAFTTGCGETRYWCHPTKPMLDAWAAENYACEGEAYQRARDRGDEGSKKAIKAEWEKCMRARGWTPCPKPDED